MGILQNSKIWDWYRQRKYKECFEYLKLFPESEQTTLISDFIKLTQSIRKEPSDKVVQWIKKNHQKIVKTGDTIFLGYRYILEANIHRLSQQISLALKINAESILIFQNSSDKWIKGRYDAYNQRGIFYFLKGDYQKAANNFQKALDLVELEFYGQESLKDALNAMTNLAASISNLGKKKEARKLYEKTLKTIDKIDDKSLLSLILNNLGECLFFEGDYPAAMQSLEKALKYAEIYDKGVEKALILNQIARIYSNQGKFYEAEDLFVESLTIVKLTEKYLVPYINYTIAMHYRLKGEVKKAIKYLKESIADYEQFDSLDTEYQKALCTIAELYGLTHEFEKAFTYLNKARKISKFHESEMELALVELNFARIMINQSNFFGAIFILEGFKQDKDQFKNQFLLIERNFLLIEAYLRKSRLDQSKIDNNKITQYFDEIIEFAKGNNLIPLLIRAKSLQSIYYFTLSEKNEVAIEMLRKNIQLAKDNQITRLEEFGTALEQELLNNEPSKENLIEFLINSNLKYAQRLVLLPEDRVLINKISTVLITQTHQGPSVLYDYNLPTKLSEVSKVGAATYLTIAIGQGNHYNNGLYGPLPFNGLEGYLTIIYSFETKDEMATDARLKQSNLCILAIIFPKTLSPYFYNRRMLQNLIQLKLTNIRSLQNINKKFLIQIAHEVQRKFFPDDSF
ncbi:tetratricopeptide repeat protein [Candidatus Lokiarchaeum ossiferum]|uniref:tetratricopeptide repeat protein n=1 Tax=Candidatus Lokiarchaeum ossiferum TaxID=2951803 RepID=UPI00352EFD64